MAQGCDWVVAFSSAAGVRFEKAEPYGDGVEAARCRPFSLDIVKQAKEDYEDCPQPEHKDDDTMKVEAPAVSPRRRSTRQKRYRPEYVHEDDEMSRWWCAIEDSLLIPTGQPRVSELGTPAKHEGHRGGEQELVKPKQEQDSRVAEVPVCLDDGDRGEKQDAHGKRIKYQCTICKKILSHRHTLEQHVRIHTGEKPFACTFCEKRFTARNGLTLHLRTHTGERPYVCEHCGKGFPHSGDLHQHVTVHTGELPWACDLCDVRFRLKCTMTRHRRTHTGVREAFVRSGKASRCAQCGVVFIRAHDLARHIVVHHVEKKVRDYRCEVCGKAFLERPTLANHRASVHTDARPYACTDCDKCYKDGSSLRKHVRFAHLGFRPYQCTECSMTFTSTSALRLHVRKHV